MKVVTVKQMVSIERQADASGLSYQKMMNNAGLKVAKWVYEFCRNKNFIIGLVGSGNNGGDTLIALKWLAKWGLMTAAFLVNDRKKDPALVNYQKAGCVLVNLAQNKNYEILDAYFSHNCVVLDGILGTGFRTPLEVPLRSIMENISKRLRNRLNVLTIAIDCPSGTDCDTGETAKEAISANYTLAMGAVKQGLLKLPARSFAGNIHLINIGIEPISDYIPDNLPEMINSNLLKSTWPQRPPNGHKGTFGTCLVMAGSIPYSGAAYLAGKSAYRAGCGLVHMVTTNQVYENLSGQFVEAVWTTYEDEKLPNEKEIKQLENLTSSANSIVIGPGWGLSKNKFDLLNLLINFLPKQLPTLIDADGLKLLSKINNWWEKLPNKTVITPHPGEMAILTGLDINEIQSNRWDVAAKFAQKWNLYLILKGAMTVIASPQGELFINPLSDSVLATAGSGDVLSGIIGGLLAQRLTVPSASLLGTWVHSEAGLIAKQKFYLDMCVTAVDILNCLPDAFLNTKEAG